MLKFKSVIGLPFSKKVIPFIIGLLSSTLTFSQDNQADSVYNLSLEEILNVPVSVSSKTSQTLDDSPGTVRVITRQQISDMNARTLKDVLNVFIPGMDVTPNSFKYDDRGEFYFSRGIYTDFSQQILILFNGTNKFSETTFGSPFVAMDFTLENIDHIEVSSSPAPVQGGSAITTLNLITRDKTIDGSEIQINTGYNSSDFLQSNKVSGQIGKTTSGGWHVGSSFQVYSDKGQAYRLPAGNGGFLGSASDLRDGTKNASNFTINFTSPNKKLEIGSWYKVTNKDAFLSGLSASQSSNPYNYQGKIFSTYLSYSPSARWTLTSGAVNYYFENFYQYGTPSGYNNYNYDYYLESLHKYAVSSHSFVYGVKAEFEGQSKSNTFVWKDSLFVIDHSLQVAPNSNRTILSAFAEDNWKVSNHLNFAAGGRLDHYNSFGNTEFTTMNPRLSAIYDLNPNMIFKALFATSFRAPAIYDVQGNGIPPLSGQASVKPEKIKTTEVSFLYKKENFRFRVVEYYSNFSDGIVFSQKTTTDPLLYASNSNSIGIYGTEVDFNFQPSKYFYLFLNGSKLSYLDNAPLYYLPSFYLNGGTNLKVKDLNFNLTGYYRGVRELPASLVINKQYASKAQFNSNLSITYDFHGTKLYTLVENLLNGDYYMPLSADGYLHPLRKRVVNVGLIVKL